MHLMHFSKYVLTQGNPAWLKKPDSSQGKKLWLTVEKVQREFKVDARNHHYVRPQHPQLHFKHIIIKQRCKITN